MRFSNFAFLLVGLSAAILLSPDGLDNATVAQQNSADILRSLHDLHKVQADLLAAAEIRQIQMGIAQVEAQFTEAWSDLHSTSFWRGILKSFLRDEEYALSAHRAKDVDVIVTTIHGLTGMKPRVVVKDDGVSLARQ
ncbi:hypothetical protein HKX48_004746 [Thoreauomyces humboldtii]|nr:hypothetical protein HKX48_004746 [Thoreauomyces humboldtii]